MKCFFATPKKLLIKDLCYLLVTGVVYDVKVSTFQWRVMCKFIIPFFAKVDPPESWETYDSDPIAKHKTECDVHNPVRCWSLYTHSLPRMCSSNYR